MLEQPPLGPPFPYPLMALSHGGPSPLAGQTQPTAAANGSRSPEHSGDGCSWCDEGRLAPGTRPPTSGRPVTATVTPPSRAHRRPPAASSQLRGPPLPVARPVSRQRPPRLLFAAPECTCFPNETEHPSSPRLGRGRRRRRSARRAPEVKEVSPPRRPPPPPRPVE